VANFESNSVTELKPSKGSRTDVITGEGLSQPESLNSDGTHVWVASLDANSITELSAPFSAPKSP
jgi:hypothetical protein